jgi:hypothetical protein
MRWAGLILNEFSFDLKSKFRFDLLAYVCVGLGGRPDGYRFLFLLLGR